MSRYLLTLLAAASAAYAQCAGSGCVDNGMGSLYNPGGNSTGAIMTQWMTSDGTWQQIAAPMTFSSNTAPQTIQVTVGGSAGKVYTPNSVTANVGDIIQFNFQSENHTVTQSGFTTPCIAMTSGAQSGFMPNAADTMPNPAFQMQVTVSTPLWFYCQQTGHCGEGMVFSVNPTADKTQDMFAQNAMMQNGTSTSTSVTSAAPPASSVVMGTGSVDSSGSCNCQCLCGANSYMPGLGVGQMGGYGGMISVSSMAPPPMETIVSSSSCMGSDCMAPPPPPSYETTMMAPPPMAETTMMAPPPVETIVSSSSCMGSDCMAPPPSYGSSGYGSSGSSGYGSSGSSGYGSSGSSGSW